jgi:hypothetical protein
MTKARGGVQRPGPGMGLGQPEVGCDSADHVANAANPGFDPPALGRGAPCR